MSEYIVRLPISGTTDVFMKITGEIVRCRDCACWHKGYCGRHSYEVVNKYGDTYTEGLFPMDEDDFCSLGERNEGGDD